MCVSQTLWVPGAATDATAQAERVTCHLSPRHMVAGLRPQLAARSLSSRSQHHIKYTGRTWRGKTQKACTLAQTIKEQYQLYQALKRMIKGFWRAV
ncbi:hypothetical protein ElyMa_001952100 [Elysia marginata]|uniref:Secreted protein n=1 Tax=Elysia marginata TaxID=1093978 RepID=A0AAV4EY11_9GAST|nr:hypothetical protein ElyMa_001952100 [Elysia marginata]